MAYQEILEEFPSGDVNPRSWNDLKTCSASNAAAKFASVTPGELRAEGDRCGSNAIVWFPRLLQAGSSDVHGSSNTKKANWPVRATPFDPLFAKLATMGCYYNHEGNSSNKTAQRTDRMARIIKIHKAILYAEKCRFNRRVIRSTQQIWNRPRPYVDRILRGGNPCAGFAVSQYSEKPAKRYLFCR